MPKITSAALALSLALTAQGALAMTESFDLVTKTGTLFGTLEMPEKVSGRVPVALLISGSGPTDRDGNSAVLPGKNDGLKQLAEALAAQGIASVRYDKRGIAASQQAAASIANDTQAIFRAEVNDAADWIAKLSLDTRFNGIAVLGHSQGSLMGILAAQKGSVSAYVSLEGGGENVYDTLKRQLSPQLPPELMAKVQVILDENKAGRTVTNLPAELNGIPSLAALFAPATQPYIAEWMKHDPAAELAKLTCPVLIVQGSADTQVSANDAALLAKARPGIQLATFQGMAHTLKVAEMTQESQMKAYTDPSVPLAPGLVEAIASFIKASVK